MVADGRLHPDSLAFSQICTLIRAHLYPHEMTRYHMNQGNPMLPNKEIVITFPEREVKITKKEFDHINLYQHNEHIMRLLTGTSKTLPQ